MRIDAHQHFWNYDRKQHDWINESMRVIQRNFGPSDLQPLLAQNGFDGCVAVQVDQTEQETEWLLNLAEEHRFIKGIVGWIDLQAANIVERLDYFSQFKTLKGFRHIVQGEGDPQFLARPAFRKGIRLLNRFRFTYDILIYPHQLQAAVDFAAAFPDQPFVLDHLAKPYIKDGLIDEWYGDLKKLAALPNVNCKVSGLVTEADWMHHKPTDFTPYLDAALQAFGSSRLLFGSDWPVCLVAASYDNVVHIVNDFFKTLSKGEQDQIFGSNAIRFYNLNQ